MMIHNFMYLLHKKWKDISNTFVSVLLGLINYTWIWHEVTQNLNIVTQ